MIFLHTKPAPFTPPWYKDGGPVYMIRAGTAVDRELLEAELSGRYDAGRVFDFELAAAFNAAIDHLLADSPEQLAELRALLGAEAEVAEANAAALDAAAALPEEEQEAYLKANLASLSDNDRQTLAETRALVAKYWPEYAALTARQARRNNMVPLLAFGYFCGDWSGLDHPFEKGMDGLVSMKAIGNVPPLDMKAAGLHAYRLLYAGEDVAKNSDAPSRSANGRATSPSGAASERKAGKSRASPGGKTPA